MRDAYERFFASCLPKDELFQFGLDEIIYCKESIVQSEWEALLHRVNNNQQVYIRGFGRNSSGSHLFQEFYRLSLGNENVRIDLTNNARPTEWLRQFTGFSKTPKRGYEQLRNYQVSHVFGRTKNVFAFTAPWNIVYIPKLLDPFTGHEAKGEAVSEFTEKFQSNAFAKFSEQIRDFNNLMENHEFRQHCDSAIQQMERSGRFDGSEMQKLRSAVQSELSPIELKA